MIVPYADAAALMLANLDRRNAMSRHRVGLALPEGMRGRVDVVGGSPSHQMSLTSDTIVTVGLARRA